MQNVFNKVGTFVRSFAQEEDGAQIIEYSLIIAVVSLVLIGAFSALSTTDFDAFINRVGDLLNPTAPAA